LFGDRIAATFKTYFSVQTLMLHLRYG